MSETLFPVPAGNHLLMGDLHKQVVERALASHINIFVVGGYLRDLVLHQVKPQFALSSKDIDYAIADSSAFDFAHKLANEMGGHFVALDKANDIARIVMPNGHILDFAGCLSGGIKQDIARRDFTINSLYIDLKKDQKNIIDLVGGIDDIKSGIIRATVPSIFIDDPLRVLRAFRFAASLKFSIDSKTAGWIKDNAYRIVEAAGERISSELFLTFGSCPSADVIKMLAETGIFEAIFPELKATRSVTNNAYHHLNLFDHSVEAVIKAEVELTQRQDIWQKTNILENISSGISHLAVCKVACLLHDIGKPSTWVITEEDKHTFIGHEKVGEQMVPAIAERLRWSKTVENLVSMLIALHLRPGQLFHQQQATVKGINRLYRKAQNDFPSLILLALGDLSATKGPQMTEEKSSFLHNKFYDLLSGFSEYYLAKESMEKLLDGNDIMKLLGVGPGKELGQILLALQEAQEMKEIVNRSQAEDFVRSWHLKKDQ